MRIVVVGAGMAGLSCAQRLTRAGHDVTLLDKGRGAGGRMATRRVETASGQVTFDHGAQFFTASDPAFEAQIRLWETQGTVARWPAAGHAAWVGVPTMNAPLKAMADDLDVRWATRATELSGGGRQWKIVTEKGEAFEANAVVVALPSEQTAELIGSVAQDWAALAKSAESAPCWTVMLALSEPLRNAPDCLRGDETATLSWAARNSAKPGRSGPETWILQAGPLWSARNIEAAAAWVEAELIAALSERLGVALPADIVRLSHRWRYARSGADGSGGLWDSVSGLGVCGDWLVGPRVEGAWLSGVALADHIGGRV